MHLYAVQNEHEETDTNNIYIDYPNHCNSIVDSVRQHRNKERTCLRFCFSRLYSCSSVNMLCLMCNDATNLAFF